MAFHTRSENPRISLPHLACPAHSGEIDHRLPRLATPLCLLDYILEFRISSRFDGGNQNAGMREARLDAEEEGQEQILEKSHG